MWLPWNSCAIQAGILVNSLAELPADTYHQLSAMWVNSLGYPPQMNSHNCKTFTKQTWVCLPVHSKANLLTLLFLHYQFCYREELTSCWICFFYFNLAFHCFWSLKRHCSYLMSGLGEPCSSAWMFNQKAFVQDPVHLLLSTGRKKLTHLLPEACHSRRYL